MLCILPVWLQVSVADERHRGLKEALECDIATIGGHADKIKVGKGRGCEKQQGQFEAAYA
jgi:hypothetical protein